MEIDKLCNYARAIRDLAEATKAFEEAMAHGEAAQEAAAAAKRLAKLIK